MATAAQIRANQLNARRSTGPASQAGKQASTRNRTTHGLCQLNNQSFYLLDDENSEKFGELRVRLEEKYQAKTETERILVQRLADHELLRTCASCRPASSKSSTSSPPSSPLSTCAAKPPTNELSTRLSRNSKI